MTYYIPLLSCTLRIKILLVILQSIMVRNGGRHSTIFIHGIKHIASDPSPITVYSVRIMALGHAFISRLQS